MRHLGDYVEDSTIDFKFSTVSQAFAPITLAGTPTVAVYKDNNTTETTTGVTLTVDFDGRTGLHNVRIVTTDAFYVANEDYAVVLTAGTADGVSVVGRVLATFSLRTAGTGFPAVDASNRVDVGLIRGQVLTLSGNVVTFPFGVLLQPTAESTVALNIRGGAAATGLWIRGGNYAATPDVTGSGLVIATGTDSGNNGVHRSIILTKGATPTEGVSVTGNINAVLDTVTTATNLTTNNDKTGYSLTAGTGLGNQTSNITGNLSGSVGSVSGAVGSVTGAVGSVTGNVGGNVTGSVGSISGITFPTNFSSLGINASGHITRVVLVDTATTLTNLPTIPANWLTAAGIATDAGTELATALLDLTDGIETGLTLRGATRLIAAASVGELSGAATSTITIRNAIDTKTRITATVTADGDRTAVTTDAT